MIGDEGEADVRLDDLRPREPGLEIEKRQRVGKAEERAAVLDRPDPVGRTAHAKPGARPGGLQPEPLAGEEREPALGREEEQPAAAVVIERGEAAEVRPGELEPRG